MEKLVQAKIVEIVTRMQGCKVMSLLGEEELQLLLLELSQNDGPQFVEILEALVQTGELIEIEYVLPLMGYRVKSFLLPKATKVTVIER